MVNDFRVRIHPELKKVLDELGDELGSSSRVASKELANRYKKWAYYFAKRRKWDFRI